MSEIKEWIDFYGGLLLFAFTGVVLMFVSVVELFMIFAYKLLVRK